MQFSGLRDIYVIFSGYDQSLARAIQGDAHRVGIGSDYLHNLLYMYAGGYPSKNQHERRHLTDLGYIEDNQLTAHGKLMFNHLSDTKTPSISVQELADQNLVADTLRNSAGLRLCFSEIKRGLSL